jgi:hypothetical protein
MHFNRRFLYAGVFLVAIGAALVAADLGAIDTPTLTDAIRLWPLVFIALGVAVVLRRTRFNVPSGLLAAALPGLVLGSTLAVVPRFTGDCGARGVPTNVASQQGTFDGAATVTVRTGCGSLTVGTAPGNAWQLQATNTQGHPPVVQPSPQSLSVLKSSDTDGWDVLTGGRDDWHLTLPTSEIAALALAVNAGQGQANLAGADIDRLAVTSNLSRLTVDASSASVGELSAVVNFGQVVIDLPGASDLTGSLRLGAGELEICSPSELGLNLELRGTGERVTVNGLQQSGSEWQSPNYRTAAHHADLRITASFGAVNINPIGGCK